MRAVVIDSLEVEVTIKPGVRMVRSLMSFTPVSFSNCSETTVMTIGTSWTLCSRFCAVTMTVSMVRSSACWDACCANTGDAPTALNANVAAMARLNILLRPFMDPPLSTLMPAWCVTANVLGHLVAI